jgi:hypothetical protein
MQEMTASYLVLFLSNHTIISYINYPKLYHIESPMYTLGKCKVWTVKPIIYFALNQTFVRVRVSPRVRVTARVGLALG